MYEILSRRAFGTGADIVICGWNVMGEGGEILGVASGYFPGVITREQAVHRISGVEEGGLCCALFCKLYKREIFGNIRFPVLEMSEDIYLLPRIVAAAEKITSVPDAPYYYDTAVPTSIMHNGGERPTATNLARVDASIEQARVFRELGFTKDAGIALYKSMGWLVDIRETLDKRDPAVKTRVGRLHREICELYREFPRDVFTLQQKAVFAVFKVNFRFVAAARKTALRINSVFARGK